MHYTISLSRSKQVCLLGYISRNTSPIIRQHKWCCTDLKEYADLDGNSKTYGLTHIETDLLPKNLNFSITSKTLPNKDIIATIKDAVKDLEKEEADMTHAKVSLTL